MAYYCCLCCPRHHKTEKKLDSKCETCGKKYGFCLNHPPSSIGAYTIIKPLGRGFYGAAYQAEKGFLKTKCVIKIIPKKIYEFFDRDFLQECELHAVVAEQSNHIIKIRECHEEIVTFSDPEKTTLDCNIAELDYVNGSVLKKFVEENDVTIEEITQIAIDLIQIHREFNNKLKNHNDLHAENIIVARLPKETRRTDAIDDEIKAMAIDLGAIGSLSRSDSNKGRLGDLQSIATHINKLIAKILKRSNGMSDREYRITLALQEVIQSLIPDPENARDVEHDVVIDKIKNAVHRASQTWAPWRQGFVLRNFSDYYNAQSLEPWNIPSLFVDPDKQWLHKISQPGPQIITGMRGCGKTHLLRSLEFHARAARRQQEEDADIINRLREDNFIGLYVSANKIIDLKSDSIKRTETKIAKVYIYYALQSVRSLLHLKDIDVESINPGAHLEIARCVESHIDSEIKLTGSASLNELERTIERLAVDISRPDSTYVICSNPSELFTNLAVSIKRCSPLWNNSTVFFLLDDVSTRFLNILRIDNVLTLLLFNNPECAFKITSEWQTIELGLKSQGQQHPIREGRDVDHYDFGGDVLKTLKKKGKKFLSNILSSRAEYYEAHPQLSPETLLGTVPLITIAKEIAKSKKTSSARKRVYRGINCLTHVCVGEIGDVIKLYEEILRCYKPGVIPINDLDQSQCFQDMSSKRLFMLNRRNTNLKDCAKSFAEASYSLMVKSYRKEEYRIRQYNLIYVKVTASDAQEVRHQKEQLRELIDAGVFVYSGGAARTKTLHSDPELQFKLSFRKLFGLANYIGLSDRDRFELAGDELQYWLDHPEKGKEVLLRNLGGPDEDFEDEELNAAKIEDVDATYTTPKLQQKTLFDINIPADTKERPSASFPKQLPLEVNPLDKTALKKIHFTTVLTGLGFEDRTLKSNEILSSTISADRVIALRYKLKGYSEEIIKHWSGADIEILEYADNFLNKWNLGEDSIIDISGLAKPVIFLSVLHQLTNYGKTYISYSEAQEYYPLQSSIERVLAAEKNADPYQILESVASLATGDELPYDHVPLYSIETDETRSRSLIAFVEPKYQRLLSFLDDREFDNLSILYSNSGSPRARLAKIASRVISNTHKNVTIGETEISSLKDAVSQIDKYYTNQYLNLGSNVEIALTGSKIQAVASAIVSLQRRVSKVWYVRPRSFAKDTFSKGFKEFRTYEIKI